MKSLGQQMWVVAGGGYKTTALLLPGHVGLWGGGVPSVPSPSREEEDWRQVPARQRNMEVGVSGDVVKPPKHSVLPAPPRLTPWDTGPCRGASLQAGAYLSQQGCPMAGVRQLPASSSCGFSTSVSPWQDAEGHAWSSRQKLLTPKRAGHKALGLLERLRCSDKTGGLQFTDRACSQGRYLHSHATDA